MSARSHMHLDAVGRLPSILGWGRSSLSAVGKMEPPWPEGALHPTNARTLVRRIDMVALDPPPARRPILLFAFANDARAGRYLPSLGEEIGALRRALSKAADGGLCELIVRESTTREELLEILSDARYRRRIALVHFAGHATADYLLLEGAGAPVAARAGGLVELLSALDSLEVVFLNGCSTLPHARRLTGAGVPAVISTERSVADERARRFATDFYRELGEGSTIEEAFDRAHASARCFRPGDELGPRRDLAAPSDDAPTDTAWRLTVAGSSQDARQWSLPSAANNPLFGIPAPVQSGFPQEPFRGLCRFTAKDAGIFFGRGELIRRLYEDVCSSDLPHALVVYGPSGAGKSSLLEAGLLPRLHTRFDVHLLRLERGGDPEQALLEALHAKGGMSVTEAWLAREHDIGRPVVICVDQVESVLIGSQGATTLSRFIWALAPLLGGETRPRGKLILGLRKEWFPELREALRGHALRWQDHYIKPLDRQGIEEALLGPTRTGTLRARYGIEVEPGLARRIADDLLEDPHSAIAPTLQILLTRMWDEITSAPTEADGRARHRFSSALYDRLRREGLALGDFVDRQLATLGAEHPEALATGLIHDVLSHHTTSRGTSATHPLAATVARYPDRGEILSTLISRCEALYLLQRVTDGAEQTVSTRLAHDTLAPIIKDRYEKSQAPGQVAARVLEARIRTADDRYRPPPLDAFDLELVEAGRAGMRAWTEPEHRLVDKSRGRHARAAFIRGLWTTLVLGLVVSVFKLVIDGEGSSRALHSGYQTAKFETKTPVKSSSATETSPDEPALSQSTDAEEPPEEEEDVLDEDGAAPEEPRVLPTAPRQSAPRATPARCTAGTWSTGLSTAIGSVAVSPDGKHVALGMKEARHVFVFESSVEPPPPRDLALASEASRLAWSPDGRRLAVGESAHGTEGPVELFALDTTGSFGPPIACEGHHMLVDVVVFSRDGKHLLTGDRGGLFVLRDGSSCMWLAELSIEGRAYDATELRDGRWVLVGASGQKFIWPAGGEPSPIALEPTGRAAVHSAALSPAGNSFLTTGNGIYLWDPESGRPLTRDGHDEVVQWAAWLGPRPFIIAKTRTKVLRWHWTNGALGPPRELDELEDAIIDITASGDDVFIGDQLGRVHRWRFRGDDLSPHDELQVLDEPVESLATHPEGAFIVAGGTNGRARVVALDQRKRPCPASLEKIPPRP